MWQSFKFIFVLLLFLAVGPFIADSRSIKQVKGNFLAIERRHDSSETPKVKRDIFDDFFYSLFDYGDDDDNNDEKYSIYKPQRFLMVHSKKRKIYIKKCLNSIKSDLEIICRNCTVLISDVTAAQSTLPPATSAQNAAVTAPIAAAGAPGTANVGASLTANAAGSSATTNPGGTTSATTVATTAG